MNTFVPVSGKLLSASKYCKIADNLIYEKNKNIKSDENNEQAMSDFWMKNGNKYSDHIPKMSKLTNGVKVVTYNVLNEKYLKYLDKEDKNNQGLGWSPFATQNGTEERQEINALVIDEWLNDNYIVMIQECSEAFFKKMIQNIENFWLNIEYHMTYINESMTNWNMTLWKRRDYRLLAMNILMPAKLNQDNTVNDEQTNYYTFQKVDNPKIIFNLANVHISWMTNKDFLNKYNELFFNNEYPTIIAGDFNASCRLPANKEGDHITIYDNDKIKFYLPNSDEQIYSHVNLLKNAGSIERMLDLYDHIMIINNK